MDSKLIGMRETAQKLGVSSDTLKRWVDKGVSPPYHMITRDRGIRFIWREVEEWLERNKKAA